MQLIKEYVQSRATLENLPKKLKRNIREHAEEPYQRNICREHTCNECYIFEKTDSAEN